VQNITFISQQGQTLAVANMDVPRAGELVFLGTTRFNVLQVAYLVNQDGTVQVKVELAPITALSA
jgi:hypothetical protein